MSKKYYLLLCWGVLSIVSFSCTKNAENLTLAPYQPKLLFPLVDADLTLKDIVDPSKTNLKVTEGTDGLYTFNYSAEVYAKKASDILEIPNISKNFSVKMNAGQTTTLPVSGSVNIPISGNVSFPFDNGAEIDNLHIKNGLLPIQIASNIQHDVTLVLTFPYLKLNNIALTQTIQLNYPAQTNYNASIDLTKYKLDLTANNTATNLLTYTGNATIQYKAGNSVNTTDQVSVQFSTQDIAYSFADGYLGSYDFDLTKDTVGISIFDNAYASSIFFSDPRLKLHISNSVGCNAGITINNVTTRSNSGPLTLTGALINNIQSINYPNQSEIGQYKTTEILLDKNNSNITTLFNPAPKQVESSVVVKVNPSGKIYNFITDTSYFRVTAEVEIPMEGKITQLVLEDTINDLALPELSIDQNTSIEKVDFTFSIINGFPLGAHIQMYFFDDQNILIDSMFSLGPKNFQSAVVNGSGAVIQKSHYLFQENFRRERYELLQKAKKSILVFRFNSYNNGTVPIKILSSNSIGSKLSVKFIPNVKL
jgi:hypothetical protein